MMSEKRFKKGDNLSCVDTETKKSYYYPCNLCGLLNEQQATINHLKQELEEYKENWDDLVELATKTSLRNVELDEENGRLQRENEQLRQQLKTICNTCCYDCEEKWCEK